MAGELSVETAVVGCGVTARGSGEMDYLTSPGLWRRFTELSVGSGISLCWICQVCRSAIQPG